MGSSARNPEGTPYDPRFCDERHDNEREHRDALRKHLERVESRLNAVLFFLFTSVFGVLVYVGQALFTRVFTP